LYPGCQKRAKRARAQAIHGKIDQSGAEGSPHRRQEIDYSMWGKRETPCRASRTGRKKEGNCSAGESSADCAPRMGNPEGGGGAPGGGGGGGGEGGGGGGSARPKGVSEPTLKGDCSKYRQQGGGQVNKKRLYKGRQTRVNAKLS